MKKVILSQILIISTASIVFLSTGCIVRQTTSGEEQPELSRQSQNPYNLKQVQTKKNHSTLDTKETLKKRLLETYELYFPLLPKDKQKEEIPSLLQDPLPELRKFGIERVKVLIKDQETIGSEKELVVNLINDQDPTVRLEAVRLLPDFSGVTGLAKDVAYALYEEEDTQVQEALLDFFNVQPNIVAIEPALELLSSSASTRNASARTLIKLFSSPEVTIPHETNKRVLKIVKNKRKRDKKNKNLITLEAMLGTLKDKEKLVDFLDRENFRFAVAKGFALSGYAQPLFNMITSESSPYQSDLFPYTLDALQKQGGIDSFVKLMDLRDLKMPADQEKKWKEVVNKLATSLSTRDLLDADEILMQNKLNDLRKTVLIRVWDSPNNQVRKDIANTLIPLLLSYDEAAKAFGLFEDFGDSLLDEELLTLKFSAAIKANFWDAAATIKTEPEAWIIEWIRMKDDKPESAEVLKTEITQRFDALLTLEQRQQLGIETQTIPTEETH